jgi:tetratricopeptide (TPR) repeat protein
VRLVLRKYKMVLLLLVLIVFGSFFFIKPGVSLYQQRMAGDIVTHVMVNKVGLTACEIPFITDEANRNSLETAKTILDKAIQSEPNYSQSYLYLGYTYCLLGKYSLAVEALQTYVQLRPSNPLGQIELGFAQQQKCANGELLKKNHPQSINPDNGLCTDTELLEQVRSEWRVLSIDSDQFLSKAHQSFSNQQYVDADIWYQRALKFQLGSSDELSPTDQFKWTVSSVKAHSALPALLRNRQVDIEEIGKTIPANHLHYFYEISNQIIYGDNISLRNIAGTEFGILYYNGPVGFFINIEQEGWYQVTVNALNSPPAPVILELEKDFQSFGKIELNRGDQSWEVFHNTVFLNQGIHLLDVNFKNDGVENGMDRNAILGGFHIEESSTEK